MKKTTLRISFLLTLLLFSVQLSAQDTIKTITEHEYIPMAVEGAQWLISLDDISTYEEYADYNYNYVIEGDTIINAINYKKVYWREVGYYTNASNETFFVLANDKVLFGAIRDDIETKQVYGIAFSNDDGNARCEYTYWGFENICPLDEEILMFDFSLVEGDNFEELCSIEYSDSEIMQAMDQFLFGTWRFTQVALNSIDTIEGIGSTNGLFESIYAEVSGWYHNLDGYCVGTDSECFGDFYYADTTSYAFYNQIIISPNPTRNILNIENTSNKNIISLGVYNALGKLVFKKTNNFTQINTEILPAGLYTMQIKTATATLSKKFIKE